MRRMPELFAEAPGTAAQGRMRAGYQVQRFAQSLFDRDTHEFEKKFETENLLAKADIYSDGHIYEVKSTGSRKDEHIDDLAFQKVVAELSGTPIAKTSLIYLNKEYVRQGEIDAAALLTIEDVTELVNEKMDFTRAKIAEALAIAETEPDTSIAGYCGSKLDCAFIQHHHPDLPEYTIFDINGLRGARFDGLFNQGILNIMDVPSDYDLTPPQRKQVDIAQSGTPHIAADEIKAMIEGLEYPVYFLDYESANPGVPVYDGHKPFSVITFQFSIHVLAEAGGEIAHHEFLADGSSEPTRELIEAMKQVITDSGGTVVVWSSFEKTRNSDMAKRCEDHAEFLNSINERLFDLMAIFSKGLYAHPKLKGSPSIKTVLPVMVPKLSYEHLKVKDGSMASAEWLEMLSTEKTREQKEGTRASMLEYCELDTQAMVEIINVLKKQCC